MRRPNFIARQSASPSGVIGHLIASIMVHETQDVNERAVAALEVQPDDSILDIGCGSGLSLSLLAALAPQGRIGGIDPSPVMVTRAVRRNRAHVSPGRFDILTAQVEALPFPAGSFNKVMSVHTLYFWAELAPGFTEIARVMKRGGRLVQAFRTDADMAAVNSFPRAIYRFRSIAEVAQALRNAGFAVDEAAASIDVSTGPVLLVATKA